MTVPRQTRSGDSGRPGLLNGKGHSFDFTKRLYFTIDCDWVPGSQKGLEALLDCCDRYRMTGTVFFTGRFAQAYPDLVRRCHERGHQLGTHGWAHGGLEDDEDFRTAGYEQQRDWIRRATEAVEQAAGIRPVIFRAPNLWISETTLRVMAALSIQASDFTAALDGSTWDSAACTTSSIFGLPRHPTGPVPQIWVGGGRVSSRRCRRPPVSFQLISRR